MKRLRIVRPFLVPSVLAACSLLCGPGPSGAAPAQGPTHVKNFTFWKQSGIATSVPASWMAEHVTFVETGRASDARDFKAAGGLYTIVYTDPNYYFVSSTYRSHGDFPENTFGHDASGARISRPQGNGTEYYLLPNSQTRDAYRRVTVADADDAYDYVLADGVSGSLHTSLYRMSAPPVELSSDAQYLDGMKVVLAASARPVATTAVIHSASKRLRHRRTSPHLRRGVPVDRPRGQDGRSLDSRSRCVAVPDRAPALRVLRRTLGGGRGLRIAQRCLCVSREPTRADKSDPKRPVRHQRFACGRRRVCEGVPPML